MSQGMTTGGRCVRGLLPVAMAAAGVVIASPTQAATKTFTGGAGGTGTTWNTAANWSPAATPVAGDALLFTSTAPGVIPATSTLEGNATADTLSFNAAATMALNANASGTTGRQVTLNNTTTNANGTADTLSVQGGGTLNIGTVSGVGTLTVALGSASAHSISLTGGSTLNFGTSSVISGTSKSLSYSGDANSLLTMRGTNTYSGGFTLNSGVVLAGTTSALGTGGNFNFNGGELRLSSASGSAFSLSGRPVTVGSNFKVVSDVDNTGAGNTYGGGGGLSIGAYKLTVAGGNNVTSGTAGVTYSTTTLTGSATFDIRNPINGGTTLMRTGAVNLNGNVLTIDGTGNYTTTGAVSGTAGSGLTLAPTYTGTVTIPNSAASTFGTLTLSGGTISAGSTLTANIAINGNSTLNTANSGINFGGATGTVAISNSPTVKFQGTNTVVLQNQVTLNSDVTFSSSGTVNLQASNGVSLAGADRTITASTAGGGTGTVVLTGPLSATASGKSLTLAGAGKFQLGTATLLSDGTNSPGIVVDGSGTFTFGGTSILNTYSGGTTIKNGTVNVGIASSGANGAFGSGALVIQGGTIQPTTANVFNVANAFEIKGDTTFTGSGIGKVNLTGDGSISGNPTVTLGNVGSSLAGTVTLNSDVTSAGTSANGMWAFSGTTKIGGPAGTNRTVTGNNVGDTRFQGTFSAENANSSLTLTGTKATVLNLVTGTNSPKIIVDGAGTYTFNGTNVLTGLTINNGTVKAASLGTNLITMTGGLVDVFSTGGTSGVFDGTSNATITTTSGSLTALTINGAGTGDFAGLISGSNLALQLSASAGTQKLSRANTYGGGTQILGGTLLVTNTTGSGTGSGLVNVSGGTLGGNGFIVTSGNAGVTVTAGGKLAPGTSIGTLSMNLGSGALDISGAVTNSNSQAMLFELAAPGSSDQVLLSGGSILNIGSGVLEFDDFVFTQDVGFTGGTYTLFQTSQSINGSLGTNLTGLVGAYAASLSLSGDNHSVLLNVAVPEPSTLVVAGMGAAFLLMRRRRMN